MFYALWIFALTFCKETVVFLIELKNNKGFIYSRVTVQD